MAYASDYDVDLLVQLAQATNRAGQGFARPAAPRLVSDSRASAAQLNANHSSMQSYTLLLIVSTNSSITWHQIGITFARYFFHIGRDPPGCIALSMVVVRCLLAA